MRKKLRDLAIVSFSTSNTAAAARGIDHDTRFVAELEVSGRQLEKRQ